MDFTKHSLGFPTKQKFIPKIKVGTRIQVES